MKRRASQERWPERSLVAVEKDVFNAFYAIRKLMDAKKLSLRVEKMSIALSWFPSRGKPVTHMNWHKLDRLYDFSKRTTTRKKLRFISNQLIHSYVFSTLFDDNRLKGFLFCSERDRNRFLYQVGLAELISVLGKVGSDYP